MFQTFSGSSRRPRNVNLSGSGSNPFAKPGTPAASGTANSVALAQQERLRRQQERDKLNAARRIQRVWRGHKARTGLAESRRHDWDRDSLLLAPIRECASADAMQWELDSFDSLVKQVRILLAFFSSRRPDDLKRIELLSKQISGAGESFVAHHVPQPRLSRLAEITLEALQASIPVCEPTLLQLLTSIISRHPQTLLRLAKSYYHYFSTLTTSDCFQSISRTIFLEAIHIPLEARTGTKQNDQILLNSYTAFALDFLTTPDLESRLGTLRELADGVDASLLDTALVQEFSTSRATELSSMSKLWLLSHFIDIRHNLSQGSHELNFIRALSLQLAASPSDLVGRIDPEDMEPVRESDEDAVVIAYPPLSTYIKNKLSSLVDKDSISGLLTKFDLDHTKDGIFGEEDYSLLASYILTLLKMFPRQGDEIRMWLYMGSVASKSDVKLPALKFFWEAMNSTAIFSQVIRSPGAALSMLRTERQAPNAVRTLAVDRSKADDRDRQWRTIMLFLELYTFVLKIVDDEEFLSTSVADLGQSEGPVSRGRESALPIRDVVSLTTFLKNVGFTTYYNAAELNNDDTPIEGGLETYFGMGAAPARPGASEPLESSLDGHLKDVTSRPFAGIAGMTFYSLRSAVVGVMRMLYERNSRRPFLPQDHWLMTSRFDMEGFIPAVVMEEERRHELGEEDDVDDEALPDRRQTRLQYGEALRKQQQRVARNKVLAAVGPRLEILQNMPFVIPFATRVQIFRQFVLRDQDRRRNGHVDPDSWRMAMVMQSSRAGLDRDGARAVLGKHHAKIRRGHVFEDAFDQFYDLGEGLKEPIQITFVDQFETIEAGIDGGGVTKEFLTSVTHEAFRPKDGTHLFTTNDQNLLYPNPAALDELREELKLAGIMENSYEFKAHINELLLRYEFLGRVVGKCLYEGILVDIGFAGFFLLKWSFSASTPGQELQYRAKIDDLRDLDEGLYQGLLKLKNYPGNVEDLSLDFTITDTISPPGAPTQTVTRELKPDGSKLPVTNENRLLYVSAMARHRLLVQPYPQTHAFLKGLGQIINPSWLSMFNQSELQTLIGGESSGIDVDDLRRNTVYNGVYQIGDDGLEHPTIVLFWKVMQELDDEARRKVLKYVTSTPRAPLLGFSQLHPAFTIRDSSSDEERLPSTSTCVNLLKLPRYSTAAKLKSKLLYAVNSGAGFDLS